MGLQIEDGTGSGVTAEVNVDNRLSTTSVSIPEIAYHALKGNSYSFPSNFLSLTGAGTHAILYVKNTAHNLYLHISDIRISCDVSTKWRLWKNPSAGTIITGGATLDPVNLFFESGNSAQVTAKIGGQGFTLTDGTLVGQALIPAGAGNMQVDNAIILGTDDTVAMTAEVGGAGTVGVTWLGFYDDHL